jgi:hypothetical protein
VREGERETEEGCERGRRTYKPFDVFVAIEGLLNQRVGADLPEYPSMHNIDEYIKWFVRAATALTAFLGLPGY